MVKVNYDATAEEIAEAEATGEPVEFMGPFVGELHSYEPQVFAALAAVQAELGGIEKSERNSQQNFNFRSIDAITAVVRPLFGKHGLAVIPEVESVEYEEVSSKGGSSGYRCIAYVTYTIAASDGSQTVARMVGEAVDYGDKSTSKAIQMAYKYMLTELLAVGSGSEDPDAHSPEMERTPELSAAEVAQRATNKLKADVIHAVGEKELARTLYSEAVSVHGFGFDDVIPADIHKQILTDVKTLAMNRPEKTDPELTDEERAELEAAMKRRQEAEAPFALEAEEGES